MRRFLQIIKRIQVKKKMLIPLAACYLSLMTAVVMTSPTNTAFTSETTVEGKITINDTSDQEDAGESDDQSDKEENKKETEKEDSKKQEEKSSSSDEETESDDSSEEEQAETSDSDDEKESEDDSDETRD